MGAGSGLCGAAVDESAPPTVATARTQLSEYKAARINFDRTKPIVFRIADESKSLLNRPIPWEPERLPPLRGRKHEM
jgi:hypothetical protein